MSRRLAAGIAASLALAVWFTPAAEAQKLAAFEQRKGSQIAVLIVPTTGAETIEQYGIRVAEAWKLGREGIDDGVLFLVAKEDRALRLEVGSGLEGSLPEATANQIVEDIVVPQFRAGEFAGGVNATVESRPAKRSRWSQSGSYHAGSPVIVTS